MDYYMGKLPSFIDATAMVYKLHVEEKLPFNEIEKRLRQLKLPIYLFGEETDKSLYTKCYSTRPGEFALMIAVKRCRRDALLVADPGCHDERTNMQRLRTTTSVFAGGSTEDLLNIVQKRIKFICSDAYTPVNEEYIPQVFEIFQSYLAVNPEEAAVLASKKVVIKQIDAETVAKMTLNVPHTSAQKTRRI